MRPEEDRWPALEWSEWRDSALTLQLWMQIVGKIRLALTPWLNHSWHVPFYLSSRGLATAPIFHDGRAFEFEFDFLAHRLRYRDSKGGEEELPLAPQSVAIFHAGLFALLRRRGIAIAIHDYPNELPDPIRFTDDHVHSAYDPDAVRRFWRILLGADALLKQFRTGFLGKASPVHFFWGSFDLAVTRFSGRAAPPHPGGVPNLPDAVTREAYSHEVSSAGFWPGNDSYPHAAFYSYAYPVPEGFSGAAVKPAAARFEPSLGEFVLRYDDVRRAADPDQSISAFLDSTYRAAADLAHWDRAALECVVGVAGRPRAV